MAQIAKMQVEAEIKAGAETFYEVFRSKGYLLPKICPDMIKDIRVLEGDWGTVGSVKQWTYVAAGRLYTLRPLNSVSIQTQLYNQCMRV